MKFCILMGSPRRGRATPPPLVGEFADECARMGAEARVIPLYDRAVNPCLGCKACQDCFDGARLRPGRRLRGHSRPPCQTATW